MTDLKQLAILDGPYLSDFLISYLEESQIPVLKNDFVLERGLERKLNLVSENQIPSDSDVKVLTISEESLGWISENTRNNYSALEIKDKIVFRKRLQSDYPGLYFQELSFEELREFDTNEIPQFPIVIKPAIGFFSLGVHVINKAQDWARIVDEIEKSRREEMVSFPDSIVDGSRFILEGYIEGVEYAVDTYFDDDGKPHILGILKHYFLSHDDVSDRVYVSSKKIVEEMLGRFLKPLEKIGKTFGLRDSLVHMEFRVDEKGEIVPIEGNPLRFGGWCTTADFTYRAYEFNPYECFFSKQMPDWSEILKDIDSDAVFSIVILNNSSGTPGSEIKSFDYAGVTSRLDKTIELRKIDYQKYPVFGFIFAETREDDPSGLNYLLESDLSEFVEK